MKVVIKTIGTNTGTAEAPIWQDKGSRQLWFVCKACKSPHSVNVALADGEQRPLWGWDGNLENPSITPSVRCWTNGPRGTPEGDNRTCHFNLEAGVQVFHGDTWPESFRGQRYQLEDLPDWLANE